MIPIEKIKFKMERLAKKMNENCKTSYSWDWQTTRKQIDKAAKKIMAARGVFKQ